MASSLQKLKHSSHVPSTAAATAGAPVPPPRSSSRVGAALFAGLRWNRRFFVLTADSLSYVESAVSARARDVRLKQPSWSVPLTAISLVYHCSPEEGHGNHRCVRRTNLQAALGVRRTLNQLSNQTQLFTCASVCSFTVVSSEKTLVLRANSKDECTAWVSALQATVRRVYC
jgi:hypothetical protein